MDVQTLKVKIKKKELESAYLFSGSEIGDKLEVLNLLNDAFFEDEEPVVHSFYCDNEFNVADFIDTVQSQALFSNRKIILLKGIEATTSKITQTLNSLLIPNSIDSALIKKEAKLGSYYEEKEGRYCLKKIKEADKKSIVELFAKIGFSPLGDSVILVALNETKENIPEAVSRLFSSNQSVVFFEMFENRKRDWIRAEFKKHKLAIEERALTFLLETVENNKNALEREIFNIAIAFSSTSSDTQVTHSFIEDSLYHSKSESPFSLYSAMLQKDIPRALAIVNKLFIEGKEGIMPGLIWAQRRSVQMLDLFHNEKLPIHDVFKKLFINSKKQQEELSFLFKNFSFQHAVHALRLMVDTEFYVRIFPNDLKLVKLQLLILNFGNENIHKSFLQGSVQYLQH